MLLGECGGAVRVTLGDGLEQFARKLGDRWEGVRWSLSEMDNPVLHGCVGWIECSLDAEHSAGDHVLVVGRVRDLRHPRRPRSPLLYFRGRYDQLR